MFLNRRRRRTAVVVVIITLTFRSGRVTAHDAGTANLALAIDTARLHIRGAADVLAAVTVTDTRTGVVANIPLNY